MASFFTLLTTVGSNRLANALVQGLTVDFNEMALGDGDGNPVTPLESMTELTNEVHRASMNSITVDSENENQIICEMIVPAVTGGWFIREVGIFATDGTLLAVGNFPETYKPTLAEGSGRDLVIRIILLVSNTGTVNLVINPDTVIASQSYVVAQINNHNEAADPHNGKFALVGHNHIFAEYGMILSNNVINPTTDIDISTGRVFDSTFLQAMALDAILTKKFNATWADGNNTGGMANGIVLSPNEWRHVFALIKPDGTTNVGGDTSVTAATLLADPAVIAAGYTKYRYLGSVLTDENSNIIGGVWHEENAGSIKFIWDSPFSEYGGVSFHLTASLNVVSAPLGIKTKYISSIYMQTGDGGGNHYVLVTDPDQPDVVPSTTVFTIQAWDRAGESRGDDSAQPIVFTDAFSRIRICCGATTAPFYSITAFGYSYKR